MKVKKYAAASMAEAMKIIRAELGNDAVILNSKNVQSGGFLGFFKKNSIEVIAAIDPIPKYEQVPIVKQKTKKVPVEKQPGFIYPPEAEMESLARVTSGGPDSMVLLKELSELKVMLQKIPAHLKENRLPLPEPIQAARTLMEQQELDSHIQNEILSALVEKWYSIGADSSNEEVLLWLQKLLADRISHLSFGGLEFTKKFINVVGPTGVGKTTTLAKIAAECVLKFKKRVAFITTDTYRIAAIDQLKTYAKILNVPLEVCYSLEDFQKAAERFSEYDIVLIDTAGRNFRDSKYVSDLKQVIDFENEIETCLVLSLTSKQRDMEAIFGQFSLIHIDKLIFTKADETASYGAMINIMDKFQTGAAYLTNGQNVPDDMLAANPTVITNIIVGAKNDARSS